MEQQLTNLRDAADWYHVAAQKVVLYLDDEEESDNPEEGRAMQLQKIRDLTLENARQEAELKAKCRAIDVTR